VARASSGGTAEGGDDTASAQPLKERETLSQFLARILDQLSISAWLPSASVVLALAFVSKVDSQGGSFSDAVTAMRDLEWPDVFLGITAVVLGTMATQAFELDAIRLFEGYWGRSRFMSWLSDVRCERHIKLRDRLAAEQISLRSEAFGEAFNAMLDLFPMTVIGALHALEFGRHDEYAEADVEIAESIPWEEYAPPAVIRRRNAALAALKRYPVKRHRVLPTRLGNTLRAAEEVALRYAPGPLEGLVIRHFDHAPAAMRKEHDQYRSRLDLYCSLALSSILVGLVGAGILWNHPGAAGAVAIGALASTILSYRAAVATGRTYGVVLVELAQYQRRAATRPTEEAPAGP
jgi:hypothetical protein